MAVVVGKVDSELLNGVLRAPGVFLEGPEGILMLVEGLEVVVSALRNSEAKMKNSSEGQKRARESDRVFQSTHMALRSVLVDSICVSGLPIAHKSPSFVHR